MSSGRLNAVWISDIHLGYQHCRADYLLGFLARVQTRRLYLVGDIIDFWSLSQQWYWPPEHTRLLRTLIDLAAGGTEVICVPGNHDSLLRDFCGRQFERIAIVARAEHLTQDNRRLLVTHGDEFEHGLRCGPFTRLLGSASYDALLRMNAVYNRLRARRGQPYWSLAAYVKNQVGNERRAILAFEDTAVAFARAHGFDGVVCGHIHQPCIRESGGILYCNDGDWVDNCTALVEHAGGRLELLHWSAMQDLGLAAVSRPARRPRHAA